jgi:FixJ family two-component response regulator
MNSTIAIVHVVDDDESFRTGIQRLLRAAGYDTRGYASAGEFLMAQSVSGPGCLLLDVRMPGPSGLDLQQALIENGLLLPIIFLSGHADVPESVRAMKAGAVNFLTKPVKKETLLGAVREALRAEAEARAARESLRQRRMLFESLTPREQEVFAGVVAGKPNKEIAAELGIAERTVKAHRAQVMEKTHAGSLAELVSIADRLRGDAGWRPQV